MGVSQRDVAAGLGPAAGKEAASSPARSPPQRPEGWGRGVCTSRQSQLQRPSKNKLRRLHETRRSQPVEASGKQGPRPDQRAWGAQGRDACQDRLQPPGGASRTEEGAVDNWKKVKVAGVTPWIHHRRVKSAYHADPEDAEWTTQKDPTDPCETKIISKKKKR
nr:uncharacterized protein LOC110124932 isoform X3 [Odocoileus virginianus texanus]XP_020729354.1 uncharacterized protein LOC110124932 isoform X3 [Odocoileus virginianus texanus]XP_020729355.1 uncharacterized protein LOC110124932 isoform X3 [Odocoileus virginianus texanus]